MASSIGVATALATTSAFAPGYDAVTCTVGGAISGKSVIGRTNKDNNPNNVTMMETTVDKTGLSINLFSIQYEFSWLRNLPFEFSYNGFALRRLSIDIFSGWMITPSCNRSRPE